MWLSGKIFCIAFLRPFVQSPILQTNTESTNTATTKGLSLRLVVGNNVYCSDSLGVSDAYRVKLWTQSSGVNQCQLSIPSGPIVSHNLCGFVAAPAHRRQHWILWGL